MKYKSLMIKYAICIPLILLSAALYHMGADGIIPRFWAYIGMLIFGTCLVTLMTEMSFFPPKDDDKEDSKGDTKK